MILDAHSALKTQAFGNGWFQRSETELHVAIWAGFVFVEGAAPGEPSIRILLNQLNCSPIQAAATKLKGVFFLAIQDKRSLQIVAFVDNSGLFKAFYTSSRISDSQLELLESERLKAGDLDPQRTVEFLELGNIHFERSFSPAIRKFQYGDIVTFDGGGNTTTFKKRLPPVSEHNADKLEDLFTSLAHTLKEQSVSVDLTGGFDSRLVACLLHRAGTQFETALSGSADLVDLGIARSVAKELDVPFHYYIPPVPSDPAEFDEVFDLTDGMVDVLYFRRIVGLQRSRSARGVTLSISGMGGALFKDVFWLHEFPFYGRKHSNTARWFDLRMMPRRKTHGIVTDGLRSASAAMRADFILRLSDFVADVNTRTFDQLGYFVKYQAFCGCNLTGRSRVGPLAYDPLLDYDVFRMSYNLPRSRRMFSSYHRNLLSSFCPKVAEIVTTEGFSASTRLRVLPRSAVGYSRNKARRLVRKVTQRLGAPVLYGPVSPDDPSVAAHVRASKQFASDVECLKSMNIVDRGVAADKVSIDLVGRLQTVARLYRRVA
jgi:hypothetical protein